MVEHGWRTRLKNKRRGLDYRPRTWLRLAYFLPAVLLLRLMQLVGLQVAVYPDHFGHQAMDVEHHLRRLGRRRWRAVYLVGALIPNRFLYEKHRVLVRMISVPRRFLRYLREGEKLSMRLWGRPLFYSFGFEEKLTDWAVWNNVPPQISFTEVDHERGAAILARLGLERGRYVCLHARDPAFGLAHHTEMWLARGGAYSPTRAAAKGVTSEAEESLFNRYRNSDFLDYSRAVDVLAQRGLKAVRLGAKVHNDLTGVMSNLVDFAGRERETLAEDAEFADVYLMAHCRFYVGTSNGIIGLAFTFNRLIAWVNSFPWPWAHMPPGAGSIYLPKLLRHERGDTLTFAEMIGRSKRYDWRGMYSNAFFEQERIAVVDNTPEEIAEAVGEMCDRTDGCFAHDEADESRQQRLASLFHGDLKLDGLPHRVGRSFLSRHRALLVPDHER
ncbi:MAG: TIGR04372 family glycosyltransferase [Pseudorhodoplanes sp.]